MYNSAFNPKLKPHAQPQNRQPAYHMVRLALPAALMVMVVLPMQAFAHKCTASLSDISFGNVDVLSSDPRELVKNISVSCSRSLPDAQPKPLNICLASDGGRYNQSTLKPRQLCTDASCTTFLPYNMYTDPNRTQIWSTNSSASNQSKIGMRIIKHITIPANQSSVAFHVPIYLKLEAPFNHVPAGNYRALFNEVGVSRKALLAVANGTTDGTDCTGDKPFSFNVSANVTDRCFINDAQDLNFGNVLSTASNLTRSSTFQATCTNGTPYNIGLLPTNNNNPNGAGIMRSAQTGNKDTIAYQLRSSEGMTGDIWSNTATATSVGNGVSDTGTGVAQTHTVHATIGNLGNVRADTYSDKVIINVRY